MSLKPNILLDQEFFPDHDRLFAILIATVTWNEEMKARKTASFGKPYDYSQMSYKPAELLPCLVEIATSLEKRLGTTFNNCLLNLYESGQNSMGFHTDETANLIAGTGVAIVSLGSQRTITFRSMDQSTLIDYTLNPGSLLYMHPDVQDQWMHSIRKQQAAGSRISLTWRAIR